MRIQAPREPRRPTRRYSVEERAAAVAMVRHFETELGGRPGAIPRAAEALGFGLESVRAWVRMADREAELAAAREALGRGDTPPAA